ncbi:hypothetical protein WJX82_003798 [Trebouxia sp. C0006]
MLCQLENLRFEGPKFDLRSLYHKSLRDSLQEKPSRSFANEQELVSLAVLDLFDQVEKEAFRTVDLADPSVHSVQDLETLVQLPLVFLKEKQQPAYHTGIMQTWLFSKLLLYVAAVTTEQHTAVHLQRQVVYNCSGRMRRRLILGMDGPLEFAGMYAGVAAKYAYYCSLGEPEFLLRHFAIQSWSPVPVDFPAPKPVGTWSKRGLKDHALDSKLVLAVQDLLEEDLLAGKAAGKAALEVSTLDPVFDARAAHQLFALGQKYKGNAKAFALLICGRAPVQEILPALLVACQGMAPSEEVLTAAVNRLATDPEVVSTLLSGGHGQGMLPDSLALHSNCNLWSGHVTAACTLAAQLLEVAPTASLSSTHLPQLSLEESSFHWHSPNAELSDLNADSAARAWDGQQRWQSDSNAAVPSEAVALPHKILMHLASHELDVDQSAWAAVWELYSSRPGIAANAKGQRDKRTISPPATSLLLWSTSCSDREDVMSTGLKAFVQLAKSQIYLGDQQFRDATEVCGMIHQHRLQLPTDQKAWHELLDIAIVWLDQPKVMTEAMWQAAVCAASALSDQGSLSSLWEWMQRFHTGWYTSTGEAQVSLSFAMVDSRPSKGALLLTSYGDCGFDSLLTTEQYQSTAMWDYANKQFGEAFLEALAEGGSHKGVTLPLHSSVPGLTLQTTAGGMKQVVSVGGPALSWMNSEWQGDFSYAADEYEMHTGASDSTDTSQASDAMES